jgi:hypothetical protein
MNLPSNCLRVIQAGKLDPQPPEERWLIRSLWGRTAVGFLAGPAKACKTFMGIDMATSIASGTPCLGQFPIERPGPALIYLAEDDLPLVRARIESLCRHRDIDMNGVPLHVIAEPCLRLDHEQDQKRLVATVDRLRPHFVLLDPLIRLHRLNENHAMEIAGLLSYFRELQRRFDCAVAIVHHVGKKRRAHLGQSLRGSSDLHAFADSSGYLLRRREQLVLTIEHRAARAPDPMVLELVSVGAQAHLELKATGQTAESTGSLAEDVLHILRHAGTPVPGKELRHLLRVNNQRLWDTLRLLEDRGEIQQTSIGWRVARPRPDGDQQMLFS